MGHVAVTLTTKTMPTLQSQKPSWLNTSYTLIPNNTLHSYTHTKKAQDHQTTNQKKIFPSGKTPSDSHITYRNH